MRAICVQGGRGGSKKAEKLRAYYINGPLRGNTNFYCSGSTRETEKNPPVVVSLIGFSAFYRVMADWK